jgi:hypothetical protein
MVSLESQSRQADCRTRPCIEIEELGFRFSPVSGDQIKYAGKSMAIFYFSAVRAKNIRNWVVDLWWFIIKCVCYN